jgi:hypothetical protein
MREANRRQVGKVQGQVPQVIQPRAPGMREMVQLVHPTTIRNLQMPRKRLAQQYRPRRPTPAQVDQIGHSHDNTLSNAPKALRYSAPGSASLATRSSSTPGEGFTTRTRRPTSNPHPTNQRPRKRNSTAPAAIDGPHSITVALRLTSHPHCACTARCRCPQCSPHATWPRQDP